MNAKLRALWESRSPRERQVLVVLAALLLSALYGLLVVSAHRARLHLLPAVSALRAQAMTVDRSAEEISRLAATPVTPPTGGDLRLLVQAQIDSSGLSPALASIEALDGNRVQVAFASVPFADWLACVEKLQAQHVRLDSTRIDTLSTPGRVAITAILVRNGS